MNLNLTPVVKNLLFINLGFFALSFFGGSLTDTFVLYPILSENFRPWQVLTHMFMHGGIGHIFFNMFALISFGSLLETFWGSKKFLLFYMICGIGAAFIQSGITFIELQNLQAEVNSYFFKPSPAEFSSFVQDNYKMAYTQLYDFIKEFKNQPENISYINQSKLYVNQIYSAHLNHGMVGASGAITGLLIAIAMLFPNTELMLMFIPIPIKAKYFVIGYIFLELYLGISKFEGDTIAHFAHLGGALFGYILIKYWQKQRTDFY
ncbi:MAG: rhomboid family intramembrane serine protease [Cytophagaceae bacterium]